MAEQKKQKKQEDKEHTVKYFACTVSGCTCKEFMQPNSGNKCARSGCGHSSQKHTG